MDRFWADVELRVITVGMETETLPEDDSYLAGECK